MVSISSANEALKSVYLGVVANQLNINANPLLGQIKQSSQDVWGKEIIKLAPYGINGGIGAGAETDALPKAAGNNYVQFVTSLKNLYGKIEISDKAMRASANNAGAFVNLLNDEMEGLIKASSFNLGRMLYGDGSGLLATTSAAYSSSNGYLECDTVKGLIEGLVVDIYNGDSKIDGACGYRVTYVDRTNKRVYLNFESSFSTTIPQGAKLYVQNSKDFEITGLEAIFGTGSLYGLDRSTHKWLSPYSSSTATEISDLLIQDAIDFLEAASGSEVNFISCSPKVRRAYQEYLTQFKKNVDMTELAGGYKTMTFNGIPVVADRFVEDSTMYLLNTKDFTLHQLCDWQWLEGDDGKVIKQNAGYPTYSATLVKYADLICDRPNGQAKISNISGTISSPFEDIITAIEGVSTGA